MYLAIGIACCMFGCSAAEVHQINVCAVAMHAYKLLFKPFVRAVTIKHAAYPQITMTHSAPTSNTIHRCAVS